MREFKVTCLGGCGEIGMNMYLYESRTSAVLVDFGVMFADTAKHGIDYIYPDISYISSIKDKLKAVILTHGHEDHIGGFVLNAKIFTGIPIYTGRFTAALLKSKLSVNLVLDINLVAYNTKYSIGDMQISFFPVPHSIPDTFGVSIAGEGMNIVHLSDFAYPSDAIIDFPQGANFLLLDSTNAEKTTDNDITEQDVEQEIINICENVKGKVFFTTFASNVRRLQSAVNAAKASGRKVVFDGAAIERSVRIAAQLGYFNIAESDYVTVKKAYKMPADTLFYIMTGCQGEVNGALYTVAMGERKAIKMGRGDMLIFSSRGINANLGNINSVINAAMKLGASVITASDRAVHISGHAGAEKLKKVIKKVAPRYFTPIHGEYRHIATHSQLAVDAGVKPANVLEILSGEQLSFDDGNFVKKINLGMTPIYHDARGSFLLHEKELSERKQISKDGVVIIRVVTLVSQPADANNENSKNIEIETYGFELHKSQQKQCHAELAYAKPLEGENLHATLLRTAKRFFRKNLNRRPLIRVQGG